MPIFTIPQNEAPQLTRAEKQVRAAQNIKSICNQALQNNLRTINLGLTVVWNNPDGLTAQEVLDSLGSEAAEVVKLVEDLSTLLNKALPGVVGDISPKPYTCNPDGTVTVTA